MKRTITGGFLRVGSWVFGSMPPALHMSHRLHGAAATAAASASASMSSSSPNAPEPRVASPLYKSSHQGQGSGFKVLKEKQQVAASGGPTRSSCAEESGPVKGKPLTALQKRMLDKKDKAVFILNPNAVYRVKTLLDLHKSTHSNEKQPIGIRIGVKKRGCSGYSYTVNYEFDDGVKKPQDTRVDQSGVSIFVDGDALFYVVGTVMDFTVSNVEEKFTFTNPNQKYQCGCGESFMPFDV